MPKTAEPAVRTALVERAAEMLARREPVTLRALVRGTGASTMAVYTHFDGMPGLWRAVRQEGFTRLTRRLGEVDRSSDPVLDLAALTSAYAANALEQPYLYRAMFDAGADLDDPQAAAAPYLELVACATEARSQGRFSRDTDPEAFATGFWAAGHGVLTLVLTGVLPGTAVDAQLPELAVALCVHAGDREDAARASVLAGYRPLPRSEAVVSDR